MPSLPGLGAIVHAGIANGVARMAGIVRATPAAIFHGRRAIREAAIIDAAVFLEKTVRLLRQRAAIAVIDR